MQNPTPGDDRPTDYSKPIILDLLNAFLDLSGDTENACRLLFLGPTGAFVADASLSIGDMQTTIKALTAAKALTEATAGLNLPGHTPLDPALEAELEEYCIGVDADFLMDLAAEDPNSAVAAFDEVTSDIEGDGTL